MISSLAPKHVVNLATSVPDQATHWSTFSDRTTPLKPDPMHRVILICFRLWPIFYSVDRLLSDAPVGWWCVRYTLMSPQHVSTDARLSRLLCTFSIKLNSLLDRLGNRRMMHDYQSDTLKWVRGSRKYVHYYIMRHFTGYNYPFVLRS
jgi:hypothetical protein